MMETKQVYKAIVGVQADLAREGISKDRTCTQGASYKFRGIDDIYNAISPMLSAHGLCILPRMISRECVERISAAGKALFYTTVEAEFDFVSAEDGSMHTARTFGEAMDSGDKGTNKAMSAAYKYAAFQTFCIPTEGDNDTENQTHEVKPRKPSSGGNSSPKTPQGKPPYAPTPENVTKDATGALNGNPALGYDEYQKTLDVVCQMSGSAGMEKWAAEKKADLGKMSKPDLAKFRSYYSQILASTKEIEAKPKTWMCPRGGEVTTIECGECSAKEDCEVAKENIKEA